MMQYNILNYPSSDTTIQNAYLRTTLSYIKPDILVAEEMQSINSVNGILNNILNSFGKYKAGTFIDGYDSDNAIFFNDSLFSFISNTPVKTALRDINQFKLILKPTGDTIIVYAAHLKASSGSDNEVKRAAEVANLRAVTKYLSSSANYFVVGDFNLYSSAEAAYQNLLNQTTNGYFLDPINRPGTWHDNSAFSSIHTQSPRKDALSDGGSSGGIDDRFDFILVSQAAMDTGGVTYVAGTYTAVGNDGKHLNQAVNVQPNTAVPVDVANALYYGSDHLPVYADFSYKATVPVELTSFNASYSNNSVKLSWITATETNNYGFEIEKSGNQVNWQKVGFIKSSGNSEIENYYTFTDDNIKGTYTYYRLKTVDMDGSFEYSKTLTVSVPSGFELYQNYPNPFNSETVIKYSLPAFSNYKISLVDILGQNIKLLAEGSADAGSYSYHLTDIGLSSGVYFVKLETGAGVKFIKIMLMK
jgi:hypothetical protein